MADSTIPGLSNHSTLTGTEITNIVQGGIDVRMTLSEIASFVAANISPISENLQINGVAGTTLIVETPSNVAVGANASIFAANNLNGTSATQVFWNNWAIINDNVNISTSGASLTVHYVTDIMTGASAKGYRNVIWGDFQQTAVSANGANNGNYVAVVGTSRTTSGDGGSGSTYLGGYWGGNFWCGNDVAAGNLYICTGAEFDNYGLTAATQKYKFGINIGDGNGSTANKWDAAIACYVIGASPPYPQGRGWQQILSIGDVAGSNIQPLHSSGTILGTNLEVLTQINVTNGIDWSKVFCSGFFIKGPCANGVPGTSLFSVDTAGNVISPKVTTPDIHGGTAAGAPIIITSTSSGSPSGDLIAFRASTIYFQSPSGGSLYGQIYPSGGFYIGNAPADPGGTNLMVQGTIKTGVTLTTGAKTQARYFPMVINGTSVNVLTD